MNRNIRQIEYNSLNLPSSIRFENGDRIDHLYAGDGTKLRTTRIVAGDTAVTDYCGNVVYENGVAVRLMTGNGYLNLADTTYHCYVRDHQGNVRVVAGKGGTAEEVNHYYPYGGTFASPSASVQPYKYNGKELDSALQWYDYGVRMYDPTLGRWHAVDPLAEKYPGMTAYGYCFNNPMRYIDIKGMKPGDVFPTIKRAALDWGRYYNGASILRGVEFGSTIYRTRDGYVYTVANMGSAEGVTESEQPVGTERVAIIHSHGRYLEDLGEGNNQFSPRDKISSREFLVDSYVATPNGSLKRYDPFTTDVFIESTQLPSDPNDPTRQNEIDPADRVKEKYKKWEERKVPNTNKPSKSKNLEWTY